jgi:hypothetical protein
VICTGKSGISGVSRLMKISSGAGALFAAPPLASRRFWSWGEVESGDH